MPKAKAARNPAAILPIASYVVLTRIGVATVPALALSSVWPLAQLLLTVGRQRRLDEFSILALIVVGVGIAGAVVLILLIAVGFLVHIHNLNSDDDAGASRGSVPTESAAEPTAAAPGPAPGP